MERDRAGHGLREAWESTVTSGTETLTSLRNDRKACYFWLDNEVVDCYQPIVGADAIWVYSRIARNAHGAWIVSPRRRDGDTRLALREMAEWCGKSVDTVWRCLQVLEYVGLLRGEHGAKSKGRYALVDVKDLVTREGAHYVSGLGSYRLPDERVAELKAQVKVLRAKLARKKSGQLSVVSEAAESVAQSDRLESDIFSAAEGKCDRSVAPSDKSVALGALPSNTQDSKTSKQTTPPLPPQAGACGLDVPEEALHASKTQDSAASVADGLCVGGDSDAEAAEDFRGTHGAGAPGGSFGEPLDSAFTPEQLAHLDELRDAGRRADAAMWEGFYCEQNLKDAEVAKEERAKAKRLEDLKGLMPDEPSAVKWVMQECDFVDEGRRRGLRAVIAAVIAQQCVRGRPLVEVALEMVQAWRDYDRIFDLLAVPYGPLNFFRNGIWIRRNSWRIDEKKAEQRRAGVGSAR